MDNNELMRQIIKEEVRNHLNNRVQAVEETTKKSGIYLWFQKEFKENWGRIFLTILAFSFIYSFYANHKDDIATFLKKPAQEIKVEQGKPIVIDGNSGRITSSTPSTVAVHLTTSTQDVTTAGVTAKKPVSYTDPKTGKTTISTSNDDDVTETNKYTYIYGVEGKQYRFTPEVKEDYKFQNNKLVIQREVNQKVDVTVPQPSWGAGIGKSTNGGTAVIGTVRIPKTPINIWAYHSDRDNAAGLMFYQYK